MTKERKPRRELKTRPMRAVTTYLLLLLAAAILLLLLAYFTQDRTHAQTVAQMLTAI